jgi:hypothetical protein
LLCRIERSNVARGSPAVDVTVSDYGDPPGAGGCGALTSARYTRDFNEVKALGSATSTERTAAQTDTARFFSGNGLVQYNAALRDQVTVPDLDIVEAARMFAAVDMNVCRRGDLGVVRQVRPRLLAAGHRGQPGRHRRQPGHGRRSRLDAAV